MTSSHPKVEARPPPVPSTQPHSLVTQRCSGVCVGGGGADVPCSFLLRPPRHFCLFPSSNRRLSQVAFMQELRSLGLLAAALFPGLWSVLDLDPCSFTGMAELAP